MRYSPKIYAEAMLYAVDGKTPGEQSQIANRLSQIISKNRDRRKINRIFEEAEKIALAKIGAVKIHLESAEPVSNQTKHEIKSLIDKKIYFSEKTTPELLAGIKILINDETLIDGTAQTRLSKIFN